MWKLGQSPLSARFLCHNSGSKNPEKQSNQTPTSAKLQTSAASPPCAEHDNPTATATATLEIQQLVLCSNNSFTPSFYAAIITVPERQITNSASINSFILPLLAVTFCFSQVVSKPSSVYLTTAHQSKLHRGNDINYCQHALFKPLG